MRRLIVIMGVAGCGKSTIADALARQSGWPYLEADDFHPPENVAKMTGGAALTDPDRKAWIAAMRSAIMRAAASACPSGTTRPIRPKALHSAAENASPDQTWTNISPERIRRTTGISGGSERPTPDIGAADDRYW